MSDSSYNKIATTTKLGDILSDKSKVKTTTKKQNKTDDPDYYPRKQREYRKRKYANDKSCWRKWLYVVEINGKKYIFLSPKDVKIEKVEKKLINEKAEGSVYIRAF